LGRFIFKFFCSNELRRSNGGGKTQAQAPLPTQFQCNDCREITGKFGRIFVAIGMKLMRGIGARWGLDGKAGTKGAREQETRGAEGR
jgi:hypothetical protein